MSHGNFDSYDYRHFRPKKIESTSNEEQIKELGKSSVETGYGSHGNVYPSDYEDFRPKKDRNDNQ